MALRSWFFYPSAWDRHFGLFSASLLQTPLIHWAVWAHIPPSSTLHSTPRYTPWDGSTPGSDSSVGSIPTLYVSIAGPRKGTDYSPQTLVF